MAKKHFRLEDLNNCEFYDIEFINGVKCIHINCYYWQRDIFEDDEDEWDENGKPMTWARTDGTFIIVPLDEFIKRYAEEETEYLYNELWAETKQYQYDMSEDDARAEAEGDYYYLPYWEITMDTPCGEYVA